MSFEASRLSLGPTQPSLQQTPEALVFFWGGGINQPGHEADYAPPSLLLLVSRLTLDGALPPLPYALYDVHRDSFTFTLMCSNHESIDNVLKPAEGLIRVSCWVL